MFAHAGASGLTGWAGTIESQVTQGMKGSSAASVAVTPVGIGYLVHPRHTPPNPPMFDLIEQLPPEPGQVPLLVTPELDVLSGPVTAAIRQLVVPRFRLGSHQTRWESIRLVVPHSGSGSSGRPEKGGRGSGRQPDRGADAPRPAVAALLAKSLGCTVVAPAGSLLVVPDHSLLVRGGLGVWRAFAPDGRANDQGCRFPAPPWQDYLAAATRGFAPDRTKPRRWTLAGTRLSVVEIPAGIWLRASDAPRVTADDVVFAAPADPDQIVVLVGDPRVSDAVSADSVAELLGRLPEALRETVVVVEYQRGNSAVPGSHPMGATVASRLGAPVLSSPGLRLRRTDDEATTVTTLVGDAAGWSAFASLVEFQPGHVHPAVVAATPPLRGWPESDRGVWPLLTGWEVEAIQAGLWIRPEATGDSPGPLADDPRLWPADPTAPVLAVTDTDAWGTGRSIPTLPPAAVDLFVARLPEDLRGSLRRADPRHV